MACQAERLRVRSDVRACDGRWKRGQRNSRILYVSPLYLRAEHRHLPELKRVIAAYGEHVVMKETLSEALSALFLEPGAAPAVSTTIEEMPVTSPATSQAREALDRYNQAVERLKSGLRCHARRRRLLATCTNSAS